MHSHLIHLILDATFTLILKDRLSSVFISWAQRVQLSYLLLLASHLIYRSA